MDILGAESYVKKVLGENINDSIIILKWMVGKQVGLGQEV